MNTWVPIGENGGWDWMRFTITSFTNGLEYLALESLALEWLALEWLALECLALEWLALECLALECLASVVNECMFDSVHEVSLVPRLFLPAHRRAWVRG